MEDMEEEEEYYSEEEFPSPEMSTASEMGSDSDSSTPTHGLAPFEPLGRRGQWCGVHGDKFYLYGGYAGAVDLQGSSQGQLDVFDFASCEWSVFATEGDLPKATSGACSTIMGDCLYMFGGWYRGYWNADRNADVYELNLMNFKWKKLTGENCAKGSPLDKDKAAMVDYGNEMLCVTGKWITPELTGTRPPPCAAFSFNRVDQHRAVLFGGRRLEERTDQLYILDMDQWHWSIILPAGPSSPWPPKRSFHTACPLVDPSCNHFRHTSPAPPTSERRHPWLPCLTPDLSSRTSTEGCGPHVDPKLLVLWGMDNNGDPIDDAWVLNVNTLTWKKVELGGIAGPGRIWHTAGSFHPVSHAAVVVAVGGSDENLFSNIEESRVHNVTTTSVLTFGVSDLFELTSRFVAEHWTFFSPLLKQLPQHIVEATRKEQRVGVNKGYYHTVNCSIGKLES